MNSWRKNPLNCSGSSYQRQAGAGNPSVKAQKQNWARFLVMTACFEFWLISEGNCCGHNCTGFHPLLQGYLCCKLQLDSFYFTLAGKGVAVHLCSGDILQWRQDSALHRAGVATAVLREDCLAAWPSSQWVAGLTEHVTSCQEMIMYWVSVLALLKEGKLLFGKRQPPLSSPDLQSNQIVQEIAQVSKCTYLCMICREVLWLGCSLILW